MKILHTIATYLPTRNGMQEVVTRLSEGLAQRGHKVTVATSLDQRRKGAEINGVHIEPFDVQGNLASGINGDPQAYLDYVRSGNFDIMANFAAQHWATDVLLPHLPAFGFKKVFVPTGFSGLENPLFSTYFQNMKTWMKHYDANVFLARSYRDIDFARQIGARKITLIPNGASREEFDRPAAVDVRERFGLPENTMLILHVGSYTGAKGHEEAIRIFTRARVRNAALLLVGRNESYFRKGRKAFSFALRNRINRFRRKQMISTALSREVVVAAFQQADLFLFPSQIECSPIVLFEAMAARTPFLTTDVGNASEIMEGSQSGLLLPTRKVRKGFCHAHIGRSARALESILANEAQREKMAAAGYAAWRENFTWEKITERYEQLYLQLAD